MIMNLYDYKFIMISVLLILIYYVDSRENNVSVHFTSWNKKFCLSLFLPPFSSLFFSKIYVINHPYAIYML